MQQTNMDQGVRGYIFRTAKANLWRVCAHIEFDDLVQDGFMVWHKINTRYPHITHQPHRMALFKTAFSNHLHDLSKKKTKLDLIREADLDVPIEAIADGEDVNADLEANHIFKELPAAFVRVISKMFHDDNPIYRQFLDGTRETTGERATRLAGLENSHRDMRSAVQAFLEGSHLHPEYFTSV